LKEKGYFCYICNTNYFGTIIWNKNYSNII
jgi:hypothetical protein